MEFLSILWYILLFYISVSMDNPQLIQFLNEQRNFADFKTLSYISNSMGQKLPQRAVYTKLYNYFDEYTESHMNPRWITLSGVRGTGKTTLLSQLYDQIHSTDCYTLFLSLDHTSGFLGVSLLEIFSSYERILGITYETLDKPLIVFLDETQYDPTWLVTLQNLLDRSDYIFVFVTGSTAIRSNENVDKRHIYETIYPISSPEYLKITKKKFQIPGLGDSIRDAILYSEDSSTLYTALQHVAPEVNTYYKGSLQSDFYRYLCYGSLPHILTTGNESIVYEQIQRTIDRILVKDLPGFCFHPDTVAMIPNILFDLAHMDHCNVQKMALKF
jgi:predicted AAA+ superfamily ATPase